MREWIADYFEFAAHGTTIGREALAGVPSFVTMAYIIAVNPAIPHAPGIATGPSMAATIATAGLRLAAMGLYADCFFAIAPLHVTNASTTRSCAWWVTGPRLRWERYCLRA